MTRIAPLLFIIAFIFLSCGSEDLPELDNVAVELPDDEITITDAWARPGTVKGNSAIYMKILNGSQFRDSLEVVSSPAAGLTELHETYETQDGMMGMRPAGNTSIPARSITNLEPGGLHIMLMDLMRDLSPADTLELSLTFSKGGNQTFSIPVKSTDEM